MLLKIIVFPSQISPAVNLAIGVGSTDTNTVSQETQPAASVPLKTYSMLELGVTLKVVPEETGTGFPLTNQS